MLYLYKVISRASNMPKNAHKQGTPVKSNLLEWDVPESDICPGFVRTFIRLGSLLTLTARH